VTSKLSSVLSDDNYNECADDTLAKAFVGHVVVDFRLPASHHSGKVLQIPQDREVFPEDCIWQNRKLGAVEDGQLQVFR
jgi:hypothetical protein